MLKSVNCPNCGSSVDLNVSNIQVFCGHCGSKLIYDIEQLRNILIEQEKTKQINVQEQTKQAQIVSEEKKIETITRYKTTLLAFAIVGMGMLGIVIVLVFTVLSN